jgi:hypothetical protein
VLLRYREREADAGRPTGPSDGRVAELEGRLRDLDDAVEAMRARLGRPYRRRPPAP